MRWNACVSLMKHLTILLTLTYLVFCRNQLFDFYRNSTDWLPRDARSGCGDSRNRLQIVLHVFICVCIYICLYVCACKCGCMLYVCVQVYVCCICVYIYVYVCMYIYVHAYIYYYLTFKLLLWSSFTGIFSVCFSLNDIYQF